MIQVIKHGKTHKEMECPECGCVFQYADLDTKKEYSYKGLKELMITGKFIDCPECGERIWLENYE